VQATRHRGWRHPALYALVLTTVGSGDAVASAVLVAVSLAWVAHARWITAEVGRARAITTLTKVGITVVALNAWWVGALTVQSRNGIDVARFTAPPEVVNRTSSAAEVLRGLGQAPAYLADAATGSERYTQQPWLLAASFVLPVVALAALGVTRWRARSAIHSIVPCRPSAIQRMRFSPASPVSARAKPQAAKPKRFASARIAFFKASASCTPLQYRRGARWVTRSRCRARPRPSSRRHCSRRRHGESRR